MLTSLIRGLSAAKDFSVKETPVDRTVTFTVAPTQKDYGKVIGGKAKNFKALELLVKLMAARRGQEGQLSVLPPADQTVPKCEKFIPNPNWGKRQMEPLVQSLLEQICVSSWWIKIEEPDVLTINVDAGVSNKEQFDVVEDGRKRSIPFPEVLEAMKSIFFAIGKNNGRTVYFSVVSRKPFAWASKV